MAMVYLAGAIDLVDKGTSSDWRKYTAERLLADGISTYNPAAAFAVDITDKVSCSAIVNINDAALAICDVALFAMSPKVASIGTPIELYLCRKYGVRSIVFWRDDANKPYPAYLTYYADEIVDSLASAMALVHKHCHGPLIIPD